MTAIILAGGFGTRLQSIIKTIPKSMAPINGIPFLSYLLKKLSKSGFTKVILAVGYLKEQIISFYGNNFLNLEISYSIEETPLGTGGAIIKAIQKVNENYVYVLNGDTYFDIDFSLFNKNLNEFTLAAKKVKNVSRYGELITMGNRIINFSEKGFPKEGLINCGVYFFKTEFILKIKFTDVFSWEKDFLEKYVSLLNFKFIKFSNLFIDIGIPNDYEKAKSLLSYE